MPMMRQEEVAAYKTKLEAEKRRLLEEIERHTETPDFGSDVDHNDEETDEAEGLQNELGIAAALKARVNEIDAALARIAAGSYGACTSCEEKISDEVLRIAPESEFCASCKTKEAE